jgi:hypothetical protein
MLAPATTPPAILHLGAYAYPGRTLLQVHPTRRRYPVRELLSMSPQLKQDIRQGSEGTPFRLSIDLRNALSDAIPGAVVYTWQHDPKGWTVDFEGPELNAITCMRGVQISDADGSVCFDTVYPAPGPGHGSAMYLQIYFTKGKKTTARAQVYLQLPALAHTVSPCADAENAAPAHSIRFSADGDAAVLAMPRLTRDAETGGLQGHVRIDVAL